MYNEKVKELYEQLGKQGTMVVATSAGDRVTARTLSIILYQEKLYFQTDINFITINQLKENSSIALCAGNIQLEGKSKILAPTLSLPEQAKLYKEKHLGSYNNYSHLPTTMMVEVTLHKATTWEYRDRIPYICRWDLVSEKYQEKPYIEI